MNCPHCSKRIFGWTGLQELQAFQKHLDKCKGNPNNLPVSWGRKTVITPHKHTLNDALETRHKSGQ